MWWLLVNKIINKIQKDFLKTPDLIIKEYKVNMFNKLYVVYIETVSSSDKVNDYLLKNIILGISGNKINKKNVYTFIAGPNTKELNNSNEIEFYLTNGFSILIYDDLIYAIETRADINRSIPDSNVESSINGPKDAFCENIQINVGLVKRRIKTSKLKIINKFIGRLTKTNINILYLDEITNKNLVKYIIEKIDKIDIDGILDSSSLGFLIDNESRTIYPTILQTERPDMVATSILQGKVAIIVDTSPFALILPAFFSDFINPNVDNYNKSKNINFVKILRLFAFFISMITPALYIALMNYNSEAIPTNLLINFIIERNGVPFPTIIETLIMLIVCEILRESDLRFPSSYGSAISILGAIVLGEASVSAGITSPITIIVIAITFISSLIFTNVEINNVLRFFRFIFIGLAGFLGLYGLTLGFLFFLIYTTSTNSFTYPYFAPLAPYDKEYFESTIMKKPLANNIKRSNLLTKINIKRKTL